MPSHVHRKFRRCTLALFEFSHQKHQLVCCTGALGMLISFLAGGNRGKRGQANPPKPPKKHHALKGKRRERQSRRRASRNGDAVGAENGNGMVDIPLLDTRGEECSSSSSSPSGSSFASSASDSVSEAWNSDGSELSIDLVHDLQGEPSSSSPSSWSSLLLIIGCVATLATAVVLGVSYTANLGKAPIDVLLAGEGNNDGVFGVNSSASSTVLPGQSVPPLTRISSPPNSSSPGVLPSFRLPIASRVQWPDPLKGNVVPSLANLNLSSSSLPWLGELSDPSVQSALVSSYRHKAFYDISPGMFRMSNRYMMARWARTEGRRIDGGAEVSSNGYRRDPNGYILLMDCPEGMSSWVQVG